MTEFLSKTRCSGQCCKHFHVGGRSRESLLQMALEYVDRYGEENPNTIEVVKIASMVIPLPGHDVDPLSLNGRQGRVWHGEDSHFFTCRHFDAEARVCTAYEERPWMCRIYPHGEACEYQGCTWNEEEAKAITGAVDRAWTSIKYENPPPPGSLVQITRPWRMPKIEPATLEQEAIATLGE